MSDTRIEFHHLDKDDRPLKQLPPHLMPDKSVYWIRLADRNGDPLPDTGDGWLRFGDTPEEAIEQVLEEMVPAIMLGIPMSGVVMDGAIGLSVAIVYDASAHKGDGN